MFVQVICVCMCSHLCMHIQIICACACSEDFWVYVCVHEIPFMGLEAGWKVFEAIEDFFFFLHKHLHISL